MLAVHGTADAVVDVEYAREAARRYPQVVAEVGQWGLSPLSHQGGAGGVSWYATGPIAK